MSHAIWPPSVTTWSNHYFLGGNTFPMIGEHFPYEFFLGFLHAAGVSLVAANKAQLALLWSCGIFGAWRFLRSYGMTALGSSYALALYAAGPVAYIIFNTPTIAGVGAYAGAPWGLAAVASAYRKDVTAFAYTIVAAVLLGYTSQNPAYVGVVLLGVTGLALAFTIYRVKRRGSVRLAWLCVATIAALNLWWIIPDLAGFYAIGRELAESSINASYINESVSRTVTDNAPFYLLRFAIANLFVSPVVDGPFGMLFTRESVLVPYFSAWPVAVLLFVPLGLILLGAIRWPRSVLRRKVAVATVLAVLAYLLAAGRAFPALPLSDVLTRIPAYAIYREPYSKFGILLTLWALPLVAYGVTRFRQRILIRALAIAFALVLLGPLALGRGAAVDAAPGLPLLGVSIPDYLKQAKQALNRFVGSDGVPERLLQLPMSANYSLEYFKWGYYGPGFYQNFLSPNILGSLGSMGLRQSENEFIQQMVFAAETGDSAVFDRLAREGGVSGILWEGDSDPIFGGPKPSDVRPFVSALSIDHKRVQTFGPLRVIPLRQRTQRVIVASNTIGVAPLNYPTTFGGVTVANPSQLPVRSEQRLALNAYAVPLLWRDGVASLGVGGRGELQLRLGSHWPFYYRAHRGQVDLVPLRATVSEGDHRYFVAPSGVTASANSPAVRLMQKVSTGLAVFDLNLLGKSRQRLITMPRAGGRVLVRLPLTEVVDIFRGKWEAANWVTGSSLPINRRSVSDTPAMTVRETENTERGLRAFTLHNNRIGGALRVMRKVHLSAGLSYNLGVDVTKLSGDVEYSVFSASRAVRLEVAHLHQGRNELQFAVPETGPYTINVSVAGRASSTVFTIGRLIGRVQGDATAYSVIKPEAVKPCHIRLTNVKFRGDQFFADAALQCDTFIATKTSFDGGWTLAASNGKRDVTLNDTHFEAFGYANGWLVPAGRWHLHGEYFGRRLVLVGILTQVAAIFLVIAALLALGLPCVVRKVRRL